MKAKITDQLIATLTPSSKSQVVSDTKTAGFRLLVLPSGVMSFQLSYRNSSGKRQTYTIGKYGSLTSTQARKLAEQKAAETRAGVDVHLEKKTLQATAHRERQQTLQVFFKENYEPFLLKQQKKGEDTAATIMRCFVLQWGDKPLQKIDAFALSTWKSERLEQGLKPASVNRPITYLKAMLNRAVEWGIIKEHSLHKVKKLDEDEGRAVRYLSEDEEKSLRNALESRQNTQRDERASYIEWCLQRQRPHPAPLDQTYTDYLMPMTLVALNTGLRRGELFSLKWSDIDFSNAILTVHGGNAKSSKTRHVPLNDEAALILSAWGNQNGINLRKLVFPSPITSNKLDNINSAWANLMKLAEIDAFRFHDLRHTFASNLVMKGVSLYTVKELCGHANIETTQRYAHLSPGHKAAAVALLNGSAKAIH